MSTVKIKTEPTTATAAAAVDVQVKLEPSLSTGDIKLEQHTSDIDTKFESDSEADSDIKFENDDDDGDSDQFTIIPKTMHKFRCEHPGCGRKVNSSSNLRMHQHEHRLQTDIKIFENSYILTRQSLNDRWPCPIRNCEMKSKTVDAVHKHVRTYHESTIRQQQQPQPPGQIAQRKLYFLDVDDFYVDGVRCGYHTTIGVFICHSCRLVPECLFTHLQQKHGYDEKSISSSALPDSTVNASADPNINQHTSNSYLSSAIKQPHCQYHKYIVQGWLCITSDCGYSGCTVDHKSDHKGKIHRGEQITTVPALVLRLSSSKIKTSCLLIIRIGQATDTITASHNGLNSQDGNEDDVSRNVTRETSCQRRQYICEYHICRQFFKSITRLGEHRREHKLEVVTTVHGINFTLSRQSSDDQWPCPVSDCETTCKAIDAIRKHIRNFHGKSLKQKRASDEDSDDQQQQPISKRRQRTNRYLNMNDFYVSGTRCGYHTTTGVFLCYSCRLVPECLLTHLQQKHEFDEKSIDYAILPDNGVTASADPSINQHTSNSHLVLAIREPYKWHHRDIVQGWLCVTSNCGYCCSTKKTRTNYQRKVHRGEETLLVPALVLRLLYGKSHTSGFLITRLDSFANKSDQPTSSTSEYNSGYNVGGDDGDELVLSDYSDADDIY